MSELIQPRDAFLSTPIAKGEFVSITKNQFKEISDRINQDEILLESLKDFKERWIAANESDDPNAFAGEIDNLNKFHDIVESVTGDPKSRISTVKIILIYLNLGKQEKN